MNGWVNQICIEPRNAIPSALFAMMVLTMVLLGEPHYAMAEAKCDTPVLSSKKGLTAEKKADHADKKVLQKRSIDS